MPLPAGFALWLTPHLPAVVFAEMSRSVPAPYDALVTREALSLFCSALREVMEECRGLEIIHVETADGTLISIRL